MFELFARLGSCCRCFGWKGYTLTFPTSREIGFDFKADRLYECGSLIEFDNFFWTKSEPLLDVMIVCF